MLHFHLLGELQVVEDGMPLPLPPPRTYGLLATLLLHPGMQSRTHLCGLLFPDTSEHTSHKRLSDLVWLLRHALPALQLEATSQHIALPAEARWLDVEHFQEAATGTGGLSNWMNALSLYQGDLLAGFCDDALLVEREHLYLQYVHLLHRACAQLCQERCFEDALPLAERLVQSEPYDEKALRTLMETYYALGRRGAALAAYEAFVSLASEELNVEPDPATQALVEALRCNSQPTRPHPPHVPPEDVSTEALLRQAQEALMRGDKVAFKIILQRLRALPSPINEQQVKLLEIDLALSFEEYDRASQLLKTLDTQSSAAMARIAHLALAQHDVTAAHDAASEALMQAHGEGDRASELEALLVLAQTHQAQGESIHAERCSEQALALARAAGAPAWIARALITKGQVQVRQGCYTEAHTSLQEARGLAHEHGLRYSLAAALQELVMIHSYSGALLSALPLAQEELSIWRDLALRHREIRALHSLATLYAQLGRSADSLRTLEHSQQICDRLGDPVTSATNRYHTAATLVYHADRLAPRAIVLAQQAIVTFHAYGQQGWEAATLAVLGYAQWIDQQYAAALDNLHQAYALHEALGELGVLPELLAYQGLACLGLRQHTQALSLTRQAVLSLAQGEVSDEVIPEIYYAHAMALAANHEQEQAHQYLNRAYQNLVSVAAQFEDEPARQAFFRCNPTLRRLMQEIIARGIAPPPASGVVLRRLPSTRNQHPTPVAWTVDAGPADLALKQARGAIALRQGRLHRLLREARLQGTAPTTAQLAEVLAVSPRTIQRDLNALRQSGHPRQNPL